MLRKGPDVDERRLQIRVGALVLLGAASVAALLFLMGELSFGQRTELKVDYAHTGNVVVGAPVRLGGVTVGRVTRVELMPDRRDSGGDPLPVQMVLEIDPKVLKSIHTDALVTVATQGPLGEPYLEVGTGSLGTPLVGEAHALRGLDAPRLDLIGATLNKLLQSVSRAFEQGSGEGAPDVLRSVGHLVGTLDDVIGKRKDDLGSLITDLSQASRDLRLFAAATRTSFGPGGKGTQMIDDAAASAHELRPVVKSAAAMASTLTPEDGEALRQMLHRFSRSSADLEKIAARTDRILARVEAGQGTLGALQKDPQVYDDLRALLADLRAHPWKMLWKQ